MLNPKTARPELAFTLLPLNQNAKAVDVVEFLKDLRRQLRGPFKLVWDCHRISSKSRAEKTFLAQDPKVKAEDLPFRHDLLNSVTRNADLPLATELMAFPVRDSVKLTSIAGRHPRTHGSKTGMPP